MSVQVGDRLGPYEITARLGAGGMGEVWRATDSRLRREVAIKVLPAAFTADRERLARFEREAQLLARLHHPNIASIFGLEDSDGVRGLVMELVDGEDLSARIARGPLPLDEALAIVRQVTEALEAAHEKGIVHRDLKPANIKLTADGRVKVLDFGLAKAIAAQDPLLTEDDATLSPTLRESPTRTPVPRTQLGVVLGTAAYMAPEQARGLAADRRSDIWSFGVVLWEMLAGRRLFRGELSSDVLAAVLTQEVDWSALPPATPPAVRRLLRRCLERNPKNRLHDVADARIVLDEVLAGRTDEPSSAIAEGGSQAGGRKSRERLAWTLAGVLLLAAGLFAIAYLRRAPAAAPLLRASINLPPRTVLDPLNTALALSPDGLQLAFAANGPDGKRWLWLRPMDGFDVHPLAGTEGATCPFWSPDSRFIGFFAGHKLKKVAASGGPVVTICDAPEGRGGSWSRDDVIVFAPSPRGGLSRVAASGGDPTILTQVTKPVITHRLPSFLPDGRHLLFLSATAIRSRDNAIYVLDLETKKATLLARESSEGRYVEPGYLMFVRDGNLMAQPMDATRLRTTGAAVPIAEDVHFFPSRWSGDFSVSRDGLLVFESGFGVPKRQLTWFDVDGKSVGTVGQPAPVWNLVLSPDGRRAAAMVLGATGIASIWIYDLARGVARPFTLEEEPTFFPVWSPDGRWVAYDTFGSLFVKPTDGSSPPRTIVAGPPNFAATSWSPDGRFLALSAEDVKGGSNDLWTVPADGSGKPQPYRATPAQEIGGTFSPDGRWLAYISEESGRGELYVAPFPGPGPSQQVSTSGAAVEVALSSSVRGFWLGGGRRIAYLRQPERKLVAVDLTVHGATFEVGDSHPLFGGRPVPNGPFDITRDGKRLLVAVPVDEDIAPRLTLITNWTDGIKP